MTMVNLHECLAAVASDILVFEKDLVLVFI